MRRIAARLSSARGASAKPLRLRGDFDPATLPWLDRAAAEVDEYVGSLGDSVPREYDLREKLLLWLQHGYAVFPGVADQRLIDSYLADVEELFEKRQGPTMLNLHPYGERPIDSLSAGDLQTRSLRIMDFHNQSIAGKKLALQPAVVSFLEHVLRQPVVCMQTLTFMHGTEQLAHQDYAFVVAGIPSHLGAAWIALEDVHPDAGPLAYYPGSHTIRKFDWGNGLFLTSESTRDEHDFADHIQSQCRARGLREEVFLARKGDVFLWHGALAHAGTEVRDPSRTRKSLVAHYSTPSGYPRDRRNPHAKPIEHRYNGGIIYADPVRPEAEDSFRRGEGL